jgi:hypothetical protein
MPVLDDEGVPLPADAPEDGGSVKVEVQGLGEGGGRVTQEADLVQCQKRKKEETRDSTRRVGSSHDA